jgi:hypothetical protein
VSDPGKDKTYKSHQCKDKDFAAGSANNRISDSGSDAKNACSYPDNLHYKN